MTRKAISVTFTLIILCGFIYHVNAQSHNINKQLSKEKSPSQNLTLARLSFWIPQESRAEFESTYQTKLAPILKAQGLVESPKKARVSTDNVFSRLFEFDAPSQVSKKWAEIEEYPSWKKMLKSLGAKFGANSPGVPIRSEFNLYSTPAGSGKKMPAGPGRSKIIGSGTKILAGRGKGHWRTYDITDGLAGSLVRSIFQDDDGYIWFGTDNGVSRFDGENFANFTTDDGLAYRSVLSAIQDNKGNLWFGTDGGGVSRFDGQSWITFTKEDGLLGQEIYSILQDKEGILWFGTEGGLNSYDGKNWVSFTKKDGLAGHKVYSIYQDREGYLWFGTDDGGVSKYDGRGMGDSPHFVNLSTKDGLAHNDVRSIFQDKDGNFWFATYGNGLSRYDGKNFENSLPKLQLFSAFYDQNGHLWVGTWYGVGRYDGQEWSTFKTQDGLAQNWVRSIYQDKEGYLWFGTQMGGVSRYDERFTTFTVADGLIHNEVGPVLQDRRGNLWFGTLLRGVTQYDGENFTVFPAESGMGGFVGAIIQDRDGNLWFGSNMGASLYDGTTFTTFTLDDGLPSQHVYSIIQDKDGIFWFGTNDAGASRYDGRFFTNFTTEDGLASDNISAIMQDREGNLWFATDDMGISRYDGQSFTNFSEADGLAGNEVISTFQDRDGNLWLGCEEGLSRYDGQKFTTFTRKDGLAGDRVGRIIQDKKGNLWFVTNGGVCQYDGQIFQAITLQDGLAANSVYSILQSQEGDFWFGTTNGVTHFRPPDSAAFPVFIDAVVADRRYEGLSEVTIPSTVKIVTFEFHSMSLKTLPGAMVYRHRIIDYDKDWRVTNNRRVEYAELPQGFYTFEIQAIDRDLNYSDPVRLVLNVVPPFYMRTAFLVPTGIFGAVLLTVLIILWVSLIRHRKQVHTYQQAAVEELRDAREMQMSLLPKEPPQLAGYQIAGFSQPAREVGGDFFDYIPLSDGKIGIALADISGKGLKGAMNAVLTSGMLSEISTIESSCGKILARLNADLCPRIGKQTFITLGFAIIQQNEGILQWANAAQPYPLIKRGQQASEFLTDGQLPLGMMPGSVYSDWELELQTGDILVIYTDGIIEAENGAEKMYGIERLEQTVKHANPDSTAEEIIETIRQDVFDFAGDTEQYDDMTIVVIKKV